jgi:hypothetical protein
VGEAAPAGPGVDADELLEDWVDSGERLVAVAGAESVVGAVALGVAGRDSSVCVADGSADGELSADGVAGALVAGADGVDRG